MKMTRTILGALVLTAGAFTAGMYCSDASTAVAAPLQDGAMPEMTPEMMKKMQAWERAGTPGPHHEHLESLVGTWEGEFTMWMEPGAPAMTSKGTVTRKWVLGGRFLEETVHAVSSMGEFNGKGYIGYNNIDGRYETIWMEDMSTAILFGHGAFDAGSSTFNWSHEHREPSTGHVVESWAKLEATSPGQHVYTGWQRGPDGKRFKSFHGEVTRK